jgi:hypothetical protein
MFGPQLGVGGGDPLLRLVSEYSCGAPVFGGYGIDDTSTFVENSSVFTAEGAWNRRIVIIIFRKVKARFFTATISKTKMLSGSAVVTSSEDNVIKELNDKPVMEVMKTMGLSSGAVQGAITNLCLMVSDSDNAPPYSRTMMYLTPDNELVCGGAVPRGSSIQIGLFEKSDILKATSERVENALGEKAEKAAGALMFSCATRSLVLGADTMAEINLLRDIFGDIPFMMAHAGGEIAPIETGGVYANRFHNQTFIMCLLYP